MSRAQNTEREEAECYKTKQKNKQNDWGNTSKPFVFAIFFLNFMFNSLNVFKIKKIQ